MKSLHHPHCDSYRQKTQALSRLKVTCIESAAQDASLLPSLTYGAARTWRTDSGFEIWLAVTSSPPAAKDSLLCKMLVDPSSQAEPYVENDHQL